MTYEHFVILAAPLNAEAPANARLEALK